MKIACDKYGIKSINVPIKNLIGSEIEINKYLVGEFKNFLSKEDLEISISDNDDFSDDFVIAKIN
jgi:hypothetical protein